MVRENNVKYSKLVMLDLPNQEARQRANCHASHKAKEYKSSIDYMLFVESSLSQALEINRLTQKPVLCTENFQMIYDSKSILYNLKSGQALPGVRNFCCAFEIELNNFSNMQRSKYAQLSINYKIYTIFV